MRRKQSQRGQVMLEFALVTPALFLLCFGAMDLSRIYRTAMATAAASRAGVHYASSTDAAGNDFIGIIGAARADSGSSAAMTVNVQQYCTCTQGGRTVACNTLCTGLAKFNRITASAPFNTTLKIPGVKSSFNLTSVSHVRIK